MFKSNLKKKPNIQILPMIDVIFFLLVFFMLFTTFKTTPTGLDLNLPKAETVTEEKEDIKVTITLDEAGVLYYEDDKLNMQSLDLKIAKAIEDSTNTLFIIKADDDIKYEKIIEVMDVVRKNGGYRLALAADKEESN